MWSITCFVLILIQAKYGICAEYSQERAKLEYYNPKFIKEVSISASQEKPNSPYLTSLNCTSLVPYGNNVTWRLEFTNMKISAFPLQLEFNTCDGLKQDWLKDWIQSFTNIPMDNCPVPAGIYYINKIEFPPKNLPLSLKDVDYFARTTGFLKSTKEKILEVTIDLKFNKSSKH